MNKVYQYFLAILFLLIAPDAMAVDVFESPDSDQSIYFLGQLFGHMGNTLQPAQTVTNGLAAMFRVLNTGILSLGAIVVGYISVLSIVHTAKEGEILGKKWSSVWLPMRSFAGLGLLVPQASGYCAAQVLMIWVVAQGVGAANQLWDVVLDNYEAGYSASVASPLLGLEESAKGVFYAAVCAAIANENPSKYGLSGPVELHSASLGSQLWFGVTNEQNSSQAHVCGRVYLTSMPSDMANDPRNLEIWDIQKSGFTALYTYYEPYVREALKSTSLDAFEDPNDENTEQFWEGENNFLQYGKSLLGDFYEQIRQLDYFSFDNQRDSIGQEARADGWMYAGSYYSTLVSNTSGISENLNSVPPVKADSRSNRIPEDNIDDELRNKYRFLARNYIDFNKTELGADNRKAIKLTAEGGAPMPGILSLMFGPVFNEPFKYFINYLSTQGKIQSATGGFSQSDPLISMGIAGNTIVAIIEATYVNGLLAGFIIIGLSYIMGGHQPAGWAISAVTKFLIPVIVFLITIFLSAGLMLGIYIPLVPYMLFLFGVLGWFITVIEAIAAAPILALGLALPSQDQWGKAAHGLLLVLNIFLRPPLMIIGFIAAARILMSAADLVNYTFRPALQAMVGNTGILAIPGIVMLYAGIMILVVNEGFQLINVLPDRVIRWIGGQPESVASRAQAQQAQAKQTFDSASETGKTVATAAAKYMAKGLEKLKGEDSGDSSAGEDGKSKKDGKDDKGDKPEADSSSTSPGPASTAVDGDSSTSGSK